MRQAAALGISASAAGLLARQATAQESTPIATPDATGEVITSITRAEYYDQLKSHFSIEAPASPGGQLVNTFSTDISTLNPIISSDVFSGYIIDFVYEGLVGTSPIDGSVVPSGLADYWEIAPDGVTYTFHLNPNATWHDGTSVTADDVVFTFDAVIAEDSPSVRKSTVESFLASHRKIDDHTVELVSQQQSAVFLDKTALQFAILPKHIWEDVPVVEWPSDTGTTGQDPARVVGSGPFRFVEWAIGARVVLEHNDNYWDADNTPAIDQYIFNVVAEESTQLASLQTGETDFSEIPSTSVDTIKQSNPELQFAEVDTPSFNFYALNQEPSKTGLFLDTRVRQALHYALDRDTFASELMAGYAIRADGPQPVLSPAYAPDRINTIYSYDPERAKALLEEAGWIDGDGDGVRERDGVKMSFETIYPEGDTLYDQAIPFMQQLWRDVGVEMKASALPFPTIIDRINTLSFECLVLGFTWGFDGLQGDMFRCSAVSPNGFNLVSWCNERYDALDAAAQAELDPEKRRDLLIEAANIVNDEMAIGVIAFARDIYGASPRVHNFLPQGYSGYWWIQYAWLEQN
jgi:peptide/nickel transport system substrate-binding protein